MACEEKLKKKIFDLRKAYTKLKNIKNLSLGKEILFEVAAKRFEYTYEILWRSLKLFLLELKGVECFTPMDCFKTAYMINLIPEEYEKVVPEIVRKRNEIVHIYDFETAEEVFGEIVGNLEKECKESKNAI